VLDRNQLPSPKRAQPPIFGPYLLRPNGCMNQDATWCGGGPRLRRLCVIWRPRSPLQKGGRGPEFSAHVYCGQTAVSIKVVLGDFMLDRDPVPPPKGRSPSPIFGPFLLWPNGSMHQDATWYGGRPQPRELCVRWGPSPVPKKGTEPPPPFSARLLRPNGCTDQDTTWYGGRPLPRRHCVRWGLRSASPKRGRSSLPNYRPMSIVAKGLHGSRCHLVRK